MKLTQLGATVSVASNPHLAVLEHIPVLYGLNTMAIRLICPEYTSICPVTNQPDFGTIYVDYLPKERMLESKSFKLFMHSFRNFGIFHEAVVGYIAERVELALSPYVLRVTGLFNPRGGIPIHACCELGQFSLLSRLPPFPDK